MDCNRCYMRNGTTAILQLHAEIFMLFLQSFKCGRRYGLVLALNNCHFVDIMEKVETAQEAKMNFQEDIRYKQRYQNFLRALTLLRDGFDKEGDKKFSQLEKEGLIQRFEYTFELAWKTFKDYLEYSGVQLEEATPRKVIKACAKAGIFSHAGIDADIYLNMMLERNLLSHTYDLERFEKALIKIENEYLNQLELQNDFFLSLRFSDDG